MSDSGEASKKSSDSSQTEPQPKRIRISSAELEEVSKEELFDRWKSQVHYVDLLESRLGSGSSSNNELAGLRESEEKLKQQQQESTRRENVLVMRLATKEQEMQDLLTQIHDLKQAQNPSSVQLRSTLLDPAVNLLFQRMKTELDDSKEKLEQAQNDLNAWKFTPDSVTGKKLMAKCRNLIQENQELGKQLSQGRVAQLEAELALQKKYSDELKSSQDELNDFVIQLDEEVEGMQSTILTLQQQLKESKLKVVQHQEENAQLTAQLKETEKAFAAIKSQRLDSAISVSHVDTEQSLQTTVSSLSRSPDAKTDSRTSDVESGSESGHDTSSVRTPTSQNEDSCSNISKPVHNTTSFSICKILAPDVNNETRDSIVPESRGGVTTQDSHVVAPSNVKNGQEGQDKLTLGSHLHESTAPELTSKGVMDGLGHDSAARNGEIVK